MLRTLFITACSFLVILVCATTGRCAETGESVAAQYRQPNVHVEISKDLLNAVMATHSVTRGPFSESIQGSIYRGTSTTDAHFSIRPQPSADSVAVVFVWQAKIDSSSRSSTQRTNISSVSTTEIGAIKRASFDDDGWHVQPARSKARSRSRITGVSSNRVIGRRVARRRAYEQRPSVDYSVARRAEQRARAEFDRQMNTMLASWSGDSEQSPQFISGQSTSDRIKLALLQADPEQLGAATGLSARPIDDSAGDLSLRLHESAFNNAVDGMLLGQNVREDRLAKELEKRFGWKVAGLKPSDPAKLWSIDFAVKEPLHIEFREGMVTVTVNARGFMVGQQMIPGARLRVTYKLSVADGQLIGTRQERIEVEPLAAGKDSEKVGVRFQVFRSMLRRRFERVFPAEFAWTQLPTPSHWPARSALHFAAATAQDEWLQLNCELAQKKSAKLARRADKSELATD